MLEYPYRTPSTILVMGFAFFAICLGVFGYLLLAESRMPAGFFPIALFLTALSSLFVVVTPYVLVRSRHNALRLSDSELAVDTPFGSKRMALAEIDGVKVQGAGAQRGMTVSGNGRRIVINQMMLPGADAFDTVLQALEQRRP